MNKEYKVILENNNLNFLYKENKINVKVIYRKRKTISIRIIPKDNIEIISPKALSISYLKNVLIEKSSWIIKTLDKFENLEEDFKEKQYTNGEVFYYLGEKYILTIVEDKNTQNNKNYVYIRISEDKLIINTNNNEKDFIKEELKKWYKIQSEKTVINRLEVLKKESAIMNNLSPSLIKIKEQKKRWGSCTSNKIIYINSRISMAPIDVIDYILVHEFCHLVHMNHSKDFYNLVGEILPKFRENERWLKENSYNKNVYKSIRLGIYLVNNNYIDIIGGQRWKNSIKTYVIVGKYPLKR